MRSSHLVIVLVLLATVAALLPPRGGANPDQRLLMTVWGMPFEDLLFRDGYARGFERLHPGVRVHYERYPDVTPKYEAWHTIGRGADVMRTSVNYYHAMIAKGMLAPLDEFINDPEVGLTPAEQADFFPMLWQALDVNGHRYALPSDNAQFGLFYNKQLFDQYNAAHAGEPLAYPSAAWTWEDLRRAAELLTVCGGSGETLQYGISFDLWAWPFQAFLAQAGGQEWDAEQTTTLIDSDAGIEALEFLVSLIPKDAPFRALDMADTASGPHALFKVGKLAMLLDGSWRAPNVELDNPRLDFAIAPLPHHRRAAVISGSVIWSVSIHSRNKRLAWQMVKWLVSHEQSLRYWDTLRVAPPALLSVVNSPELEETHGIVENVGGRRRVLVPPMPHAKFADRGAWLRYAITPDPQTGAAPGFIVVGRYAADLEQKIGKALVETVRGEKTARQALDDAAREVHAIIDRDRAAKGLPPVDHEAARLQAGKADAPALAPQ